MKARDFDSTPATQVFHRRPQAEVVPILTPVPDQFVVALAVRLQLLGKVGRDRPLDVPAVPLAGLGPKGQHTAGRIDFAPFESQQSADAFPRTPGCVDEAAPEPARRLPAADPVAGLCQHDEFLNLLLSERHRDFDHAGPGWQHQELHSLCRAGGLHSFFRSKSCQRQQVVAVFGDRGRTAFFAKADDPGPPTQEPHHQQVIKVCQSGLGIAVGEGVSQEIAEAVERVDVFLDRLFAEVFQNCVLSVEEVAEFHFCP